MREAKYGHIVINDSDIRVERDYLRRIDGADGGRAAGWTGDGTVPGRGRAQLGIANGGGDDCDRFCRRRAVRDGAGGRTALRTGLDFGISASGGRGDRRAGSAAGLSGRRSRAGADDLPRRDTRLCSPMRWWKRFCRSTASARCSSTSCAGRGRCAICASGGYIGVLLTFGLPWAMAAALCAGGAGWSLGLLGAVAAARFASGYVLCGPILDDRQTLRDLWLIPARDVVGVAIWFASFGGDTIVWRGERFHLKDGRLTRA